MATPLSTTPTQSGKNGPSVGGMLFGIAFALAVALIFTVILKHDRVGEAPVEVVQVPIPDLPLSYPASRTVDAFDTKSGVKVPDPYRWLEETKTDEVKQWVDEQDKLARSYLDAMPGRAALAWRYKRLLHVDMVTAPSRAGDRYFFSKRKADEEKFVLYWKSATEENGPEHVLIDPNKFIKTDNASLGSTSVSLDGNLLAYSLKPNNADEATMYVMDVATGQNLPGEVIEGAKYADASWLPDGSGFVYTYLPPGDSKHQELRPALAEVRYHKLRTDPKNDPVIHAKTGDPTKFIGADVTRDGKWMIFEQSNGAHRNDLYYQPLKGEPTADMARSWRPIVVGEDAAYGIDEWKGQAYIHTNENAPRYRVFKVSMDDPRRSKWKEIIPQSPTYVVNGAGVVGNKLVLNGMENVTSRIEIRDLDGKFLRKIELPDLGSAGAGGIPENEDLFYSFTSYTQPPEIFKTSVTHDAPVLWAKIDMPVDPSNYVVEQKYFPSKDGVKVPMFIVRRKDILLDGSTPFLIYGYGGFDIPLLPGFSAGTYLWLEAGGGAALMNLRGGGEFGEQWHKDGMLLKKQNTFNDCIGAANYLITSGYTSADRLAVRGGSNGGLLVGAVVTQRPDLFRVGVCEVPLLDMIRFPLYGGGKTWTTEYGSPENETQFKALYAYSPYHHVKAGTPYPTMLFCSSADDDRVAPMHAFKMTAAMQASNTTNPILLRIEKQSGHGGSDQISKTIALNTDVYALLMHEMGMKPWGERADTGSGQSASH